MTCLHAVQTFVSKAFEVGDIFICFQHPVVVNDWRLVVWTEFVGLNRRKILIVRMVFNDVSA
ncbi:hypothetical protein D1872_313910 [compost metagenome]